MVASVMSEFFENLGRKAAPSVLRARWIYRSLTGTESERIRAEYAMGCYLTYLHTRDGKLDRTPEVIHRLNTHVRHLSKALVNRERSFQVRCVAEKEENAFALPGGFLFVSRPLYDSFAGNDDEIAFVLAHEMGHVVRSHAFNRILTSEIARVLSRGGPIGGALRPLVAQLVRKLVAEGYSRRQELEADRFAVRLTRAAGYRPEAGVQLFRRLDSGTRAPGGMAAFFSSHPPFPVRIQRIRKALEE